MEASRAEISAELLEAVRGIVSSQGRTERETLDDAVRGYIAFRGASAGEKGDELLDHISSLFGDLHEDEAMRIALREQQAFRQERKESRSQEPYSTPMSS